MLVYNIQYHCVSRPSSSSVGTYPVWFLLSPDDGNRSSFLDGVFAIYLEFQTMDKTQKLIETET
jgi:hypothetical protein